jgi:hypothetical protein
LYDHRAPPDFGGGTLHRIVDAKGQFRSLAEPWANTGTSTSRLMLAVLGGLADEPHPHSRKPRAGKAALAAHGPTFTIDRPQRAEARPEVGGLADHRLLLRRAFADQIADDDKTGGNADADGERLGSTRSGLVTAASISSPARITRSASSSCARG